MLGEANHLYQTHLDDRVGQLGGEQKTARLHVAVVHLNRSISRSGSARGPKGPWGHIYKVLPLAAYQMTILMVKMRFDWLVVYPPL